MNTALPEIEHIQELNGRLWDISKPLLQACKMVYPQGLSDLKKALIEIAGLRIEDKKGSIEGQIITILSDLSEEPLEKQLTEWEIKTSDVLMELNQDRPEKFRLSPQYLGKKLKAMGVRTRISHGHSLISLTKEELRVLVSQIQIDTLPPPEKNSPNSPNSPSQELSRLYEGRESVENTVNSPKTHPVETSGAVGMGEYGESGESYRELEKEIIIEGEKA
jgi:hypothetical protein